MPIDGLTGIASGVDTSAIVEKLMEVEQQKTARLGLRKAAVHGAPDRPVRRSPPSSRRSSSPRRTSRPRRPGSPPRPSAPPTPRRWTPSRSAAPASAATASRWTAWPPPRSAGSSGTRARPRARFDIYYGDNPAATGATKVTINVAANATAADVADAINGKGTAPAFATVLTDPTTGEERLVLSARKTGARQRLHRRPGRPRLGDDRGHGVPEAGREPAHLGLPPRRLRHGAALARPTSSRTRSRASASPSRASPPPSRRPSRSRPRPSTREKVKTKAQAFVDAYNALVTDVRGKISEKTIRGATHRGGRRQSASCSATRA